MKKGGVKTTSSFLGFGGSVSTSDVSLKGETLKDLARLSKKDSTTKIKALVKLCEDAKEDDHALFVDAWMQSYQQIASDIDWRVRLEVYTTWLCISKFVDKTLLAKSFRSCLCLWLTACFDQTHEVAAAARGALPFGPGKYRSALVHYKNDILKGLSTQLAQTPQSLSEGRSFVTEQDSLQMWENLISSSLLLLVHLCEELTAVDGKEFFDLILSSSVVTKVIFWVPRLVFCVFY